MKFWDLVKKKNITLKTYKVVTKNKTRFAVGTTKDGRKVWRIIGKA